MTNSNQTKDVAKQLANAAKGKDVEENQSSEDRTNAEKLTILIKI